MDIRRLDLLPLAGLVLMPVASGCTIPESQAAVSEPVTTVREFIVEYANGAPETAPGGEPWGAQCVTGQLRREFQPGIWISENLRVLFLLDPVPAEQAQTVAIEIQTCSQVRSAEPDFSSR